MKKSKKILLTALSATIVMSVSSAIAVTAFADVATKDHEFDAKNDVVFEDFDRADISNTVTTEGNVNVGEKPYLHVKYTAGTSATPGDAIYKQGSGSIGKVKDGGTITLKMRAPENDVSLSEINFGIRGVDSDAAVLAKTLDQLMDSDGEPMPALTSEWQTYEISFAMSYENDDIYPTTTTTVLEADLLAIHIYAASATDTGTLDIASVEYSTTGNNYMNNFLGGDTVDVTAKNADAGTWWSGSSEGYIVKRTVNMKGGSFTVVKDSAVGKYNYAVIEADGDVDNLKVATTTDGTSWGTAAAYDGYSVSLTGEEKGFKFTYDGTAEGGVTVRRIYLTNVVAVLPALAVPVIDASTAEVLEDFAVAQKGFTGVWEDMSTAPELAQAGLDYRLSYNNGDKVEVKGGNLVFDATDLGDGYINFKFKSKSAAHGKYVVLKVKGEDGANLDGFRFALGNPEDSYGGVIWTNQMKVGIQYDAPLLGDNNPYKDGDWYYVLADIEESGFGVSADGYCGMDIYYSGTGKLFIDTIFFCDEVEVNVPDVEHDIKLESQATFAGGEDYAYGYLYIPNDGYGTVINLDITPAVDNFDISNLRFEFEGVGIFWASENVQGTLKTTDGKKLNELTYTKDVATHVEIDLAQSGIVGEFMHVHTHVHAIGGFKIDNVSIHTSTPARYAKDLDTANAHVVKEDNGTDNKVINIAATEGYNYAGYVGSLTGLSGQFKMDITVEAGVSLAELRFEFTSGKTLWASENSAGSLYTEDGKLLSEVEFEAGVKKTVIIDLGRSGATLSDFHIHVSNLSGAVKIENVTVTPYVDYITPVYAEKYAEQLALLDTYLDTVKPEVSITTPTTAEAGDEITITYTASDDKTAAADLDVTVSVTKDGNAVTLTNNKFTAAEGVYTVTVTVRDAAGNEASHTIQITVSAKSGGDGGNGDGGGTVTPPPAGGNGGNSGCGSTSIDDVAFMGGMSLMGIGLLFAASFVARKKKEN